MENSTILITGGSRGIGHALVKHFAKQCHHVITTATTEEGVEKTRDALREEHYDNITVLPLHLGQKSSLEQFLNRLEADNKMPDILINNAGVTNDRLALRMQEEQWNEVININLNGTFALTKACLRPMLKKRSGKILFISSVVASTGNPGQSNYCASKAGLLGLMRSLALEFASKNITVNALSPGFIMTDMTQKLPEEQKELLLEKIPMKRFAHCDEICQLAQFLCSQGASYITGQNIHINGGMYIT